jgi:hypothetical protein
MCKTSIPSGPAGAASKTCRPIPLQKLYVPLLVALLLSVWPARAESPDDQYLSIYNTIEQADALNAKGESEPALAKYRDALIRLRSFQQQNRTWNTKLVTYRLKYLSDKMTSLSAPPAAAAGSSAGTGTSPARADSKAGSSPAAAEVKVLEAGADPRQELRLHPKPGDKQTVAMTIKLSLDTAIGEVPGQSMKLPEIKMTSDFTVKSVSDGGDIACEMVISEASVADDGGGMSQLLEPLSAALSAMKGMTGTGTISSRGAGKGIELKVPANADAQTRQVMDQMKDAFSTMVVPMPKEAVGSGAKWTVNMPTKSQGISIEQTATYELASIEGDRLTVKLTLAQKAANQKIQNAAMPGLKLNLTKLTGQGTGTATFDLTQLLPLEKTVDLHTEQTLSMDVAGQSQAMTIKTDMALRSQAK